MLLTGGTGFVGGAVLEALRARASGEVRVLVRASGMVHADARVRPVIGDLRHPDSLLSACAGVDYVVHAASYVGSDARSCQAVNADGTAALVAAARSAGVRRVIAISTASVHGRGPHLNACPSTTPTRPASVASATRLRGDQAVRDAGGIVVRPHLIYGADDRWVIPALARLVAVAGTRIGAAAALHSVVHVVELARAVAALIDVDEAKLAGTVLSGNHPVPTSTAALIDTVVAELGLNPALDQGGGNEHDLAMLDTAHWFASTALWQLTGVDPGPMFPEGLRRCSQEYRAAFCQV